MDETIDDVRMLKIISGNLDWYICNRPDNVLVKDLCRKVGTTINQLSRYRRGERVIPSIMLYNLTLLLNVDIEDMFRDNTGW